MPTCGCCGAQASTERSRHLYLRLGFTDIETWHGGFPAFLMGRLPATGSGSGASDLPSGFSSSAESGAADISAAGGTAAPSAGAAAAANAALDPLSPPDKSAPAAGVGGGDYLSSGGRAAGTNSAPVAADGSSATTCTDRGSAGDLATERGLG